MKEIQKIRIEEIIPNPMQLEVYGPVLLDNEFVNSIQDLGILQPLLITNANIFDSNSEGYVIISGHRRWYAAVKIGSLTVPCIIKEYSSTDEANLEFLASNKNREKTDAQRIKEFLAYKQILCQIGKLKQEHKLYANSIYNNSDFTDFLERCNIDVDKPINTIDILKEKTGFTEWHQRCVTLVYDGQHLDKLFEKWRKLNLKPEAEIEIVQMFKDIRDKCTAKEISLQTAYDSLWDYVKRTDNFLNKKAGYPVKYNKPKPEKPKKTKKKPEVEIDYDKLSKFPVKPFYCNNEMFQENYQFTTIKDERREGDYAYGYCSYIDSKGTPDQTPFIRINGIVFVFSWLDLVSFASKLKVK